MKAVNFMRQLMILLSILVVFVILLLLFHFTDIFLRVWERLQQAPFYVFFLYFALIIVIAALGVFAIIKIYFIGRSNNGASPKSAAISIDSVRERLAKAKQQGVDVKEISNKLEKIEKIDEKQTIQVAFFGKISTGKSSLIQSILPSAHIHTSVIGGSTQTIERYHYERDESLCLELFDMPGTQQVNESAVTAKKVVDVARGVHIVVYVLDQDITESDQQAINHLLSFDKPLIVALNKANLYRSAEITRLMTHIREVVPQPSHCVIVASSYLRQVKIVAANGDSSECERMMSPNIEELLAAIVKLSEKRQLLAEKQRAALLSLANEHIENSLNEYRERRGDALIRAYSRKAMLGGMAAVGPGTDILIQGYLGVNMLKSLTALYQVQVKEVDLQQLLTNAGGKVKSQLTLILALIGNVCKAFPGTGTVLGGAVHAIAYGLIFESLGRATLHTLQQNTEATFSTQTVMENFEEQLQYDLEKRAKRFVSTVISRHKNNDK